MTILVWVVLSAHMSSPLVSHHFSIVLIIFLRTLPNDLCITYPASVTRSSANTGRYPGISFVDHQLKGSTEIEKECLLGGKPLLILLVMSW